MRTHVAAKLVRALRVHPTVAPVRVSVAPSAVLPLSRLASGVLAQCCDDEKRYGASVVPTCTQRLENETAPALAGAVGPRLLTSGGCTNVITIMGVHVKYRRLSWVPSA